jgi:hypothetical protein
VSGATEILGYIAALIIGIVLGLVGGGGSILTVPVLVYLLAIEPVMATAYSLFIVGSAALVGAIRNLQKGMVDLRTGVVFSIPAFIAVYLTRRYLMPAIPEHITDIAGISITRDLFIMVLFGLIMLFAAISMIRERKTVEEKEEARKFNYPMILLEGAVVGVLTGIVGAGGGFLIIPALVLFARLPMKLAVGTSLMIIAVKSLIGFLGDVQNLDIDWAFLLIFSGIAALGILLGIYASNFIEGKKLKKAFGYFTLAMAIYILWKELF